MSGSPFADEKLRTYRAMELDRRRALHAGYVNSEVPESIDHHMWLEGLKAGSGSLNSEPNLPSYTEQPSVPSGPATPIPRQKTPSETEHNQTQRMVRIYSGVKEMWHPFTAKFDTGTVKNWISSHIVDRMQLPVQKVAPKIYVAFNGERLESAEVILDLLWCGDGSLKSQESDFRIAYNAPFDILFGEELLFSRAIYSFNEYALILTSRKEMEEEKRMIENNMAAAEAQAAALCKQRQLAKGGSNIKVALRSNPSTDMNKSFAKSPM